MQSPINFPVNSTVDSWKPVVFHVIATNAATTEIRVSEIADLIEALPAFPGWSHWGTVTQRNEEYPVARRDMAFAASRLRDEGKVFSPVRGRYTMVPVAEAPVVEAPVKVVQTTAEVVTLPVPAPVKMVVAPAVPANDPLLVEDTGLRRMMIAGTKCFGLYYERATNCKTCPLAGFCHEAGKADYANIAARLDAATIKSMEVPAPVAAPVAPAAPAPVAAPQPKVDPVPASNVTTSSYSLETASFKLFCSGCRGLIEAGVQFARVPNRGVFHTGCVQ